MTATNTPRSSFCQTVWLACWSKDPSKVTKGKQIRSAFYILPRWLLSTPQLRRPFSFVSSLRVNKFVFSRISTKNSCSSHNPHFHSLLLYVGLKLIQSLQLEPNWELMLNCNGFNQIENCFSVARDGIRQHPWKQVGQPSTYFSRITKSNCNKFISLFDTFFICNLLFCVTSAQCFLNYYFSLQWDRSW